MVVATNAFGMGIDVRRLGFVLHFDVPGTLEAYYQEAGRAGRDAFFKKAPADCILLYHPSDLAKQRSLTRRNTITAQQIEDVYAALRTCLPQSALRDQPQPRQAAALDVYIAEDHLAQLAGVERERIKTILFYLEQHGGLNGQPALERGGLVNAIWQLRLERDYARQVAELPPASPSRPLLDALLTTEDYRLSQEVFRAIPLGELAKSLGWTWAKAEQEVLNLKRRGMLTYKTGGRIGRIFPSWEAVEHTLASLPDAMIAMFASLKRNDLERIKNGEMAGVNLAHANSRLSLTQLAHFCHYLAQEQAEPDRAFETFRRDIRCLEPDRYNLKLWSGLGKRKIRQILEAVCAKLIATVQQIKTLTYEEGTWAEFDLFQHADNSANRRDINRHLIILATLGLIRYVGDPALGRVMQLRLPQMQPQGDALTLDLATLRLKETYDTHKLKLLERYVELKSQQEFDSYIDSYFRADEPLVQRIDARMRADLLTQQEAIVRGEGTRVLVEGPAGCGKTTVLVERIKYLVTEHHVSLEHIMVTAHFNSAVGRIHRDLEQLGENGSIVFAETVNKFGERIFRRYRKHLVRLDGKPYFQKDPSLLSGDSAEIKKRELHFISRALTHVHQAGYAPAVWPDDLQAPCFRRAYRAASPLEERIRQKIEILRQSGLFPHQGTTRTEILDALGLGKQQRAAQAESDTDEYGPAELYAVYLTYLELLGAEGKYTFDDQILFALAILRTDADLHKEFQRKLKHIIIDEFQDFTPAQAELFTLISADHDGNIMVFGDLEQSIRVKAERSEEVFEHFRQASDAKHYLSVNFRSSQEILDLAVAIRDRGEQRTRPQLVAHRGKNGYRPHYVRVHTAQALPDEDALGSVLDTCLALIERLPAEHQQSVAIIAALSPWARKIQDYLRHRGVAFAIMENRHVYQLPHVANVLVYYELIAKPSEEAYERLLRHCLVPYIDDDQIQRLREQMEGRELRTILSDEVALKAAGVNDEQQQALKRHLALLARFQPTSTAGDLFSALAELPDNPVDALAGEPKKAEEVQTIMREWHHALIEDVVKTIGDSIAFLDRHRDDHQIVVTTIDHAKSEEFETVILVGANHLTRSSKKRLYVSVSRARERLFLVCDTPHGNDELTRSLARYYDQIDASELDSSER